MPPLILDVATAFKDGLLQREVAQMAEAARRWLVVERTLQDSIDALAFELANTGTPTMGMLSRSARYQALRRQIAAELDKYAQYMDGRITDGQRNAVSLALDYSATSINAAAESQMVIPFNRLPVSATENLIGMAGDGSPLIDVLNDATRGAADRMGERLIAGLALGKNPIEVARQAVRLGLGTSFTRMQTIARTEMLRAAREATLQSYRASNVVTAYRRLSARDRRTCAACLFADGNIYPLGESFDQHPNCRCVATPILRGLPPIEWQTGQEWFRSQPEVTQLAILGRGRYDLWRRGEASLDDMVSRDWSDTWGGSLRTTRVRDLG